MLRTIKTYNPTIKILKYVVILIIGQSLATKLVISLGYNHNIYIYIYFFLLEVNFNKSTDRLHILLISSILTKFLELKINIYVINKLFKLQIFVV